MIKILYIADPNSIHDQKWINWFAHKKDYKTFIVCRETHYKKEFENQEGFLGVIPDYAVLKFWKNRKLKAVLQQFIEQNQIDLVHIFYAEPNVLSAQLIDVPVVVTCRGSDVLVGLKSFIDQNNSRTCKMLSSYEKAFNLCQSIITTSIRQKDFLNKHFNIQTEIQVIRTGLDVSNLKKVDKEKLIFFPRNMRPLYDHELALKAIEMLPYDIKKEYRFLFVDKDGGHPDYVQLIQHKMESIADVHFSFVDALQGDEYYETLAKSKLVVMTPKSDGAPVSGMETIASGTSLVLPELGYDEDLYKTAHFYQPNDAADLQRTIVNALNDPPTEADGQYLEKVDRNREMSKLANIYADLVKK